MQLFIPPLGTYLKTLEDWNFNLIAHHSNQRIIHSLELSNTNFYSNIVNNSSWPVVLPKDTVLSVHRIYLHIKRCPGYHHVHFRVHDCPDRRFKKLFFLVKLDEINGISLDVVSK